jgi:hypothetical protein
MEKSGTVFYIIVKIIIGKVWVMLCGMLLRGFPA